MTHVWTPSQIDHLPLYEWLVHTNFSFLMGASHPEELIKAGDSIGLSGLAVTDMDGVYGLARTYRAWKNLSESSTSPPRMKLFYGAEIHLDQDHDKSIVFQNTICLLAKSLKGYGDLCRIISHAHRNGKYNAFISLEDMASYDLSHIVAIQPMRGLIRTISSRELKNQWQKQSQTLSDLFGARLHFCISRHLNPAEDAWIPMQKEMADYLRAPMIFSQDVFMHSTSRKRLSDVIHAIRHSESMDKSMRHMFVNDQRTFLSKADFFRRYSHFEYFGSCVENSIQLANSIDFGFDELRYNYPKEMIPEGMNAQNFLEQLVWESARRFYGSGLVDRVRDLLQKELRLIHDLQFADYFLTVWDIVRWAREQGILCQGRGSAANSSVCFVLGITSVDPKNFELLFERFMSKERGDPPDIDVDFENERREEVIQYIYNRYGRDRSAMVANVITFRRKGAFREVGKALGFSESDISSVSQKFSDRALISKTTHELVHDVRMSSASSSEVDRPDNLWSVWLDLANELRGFPRHLGIHSGGFMIADRPLHELVPLEPATMEGRQVIQWSKDDIEALGFFKIDILALGMLTAIRKMFALLKKEYRIDLDLKSIPQDDPKTYEMIQRAETVGTFQIESRAQMSMLPRLLPKTFYDLVIQVAIIRPGPIQGGMIHPFLRRRHGLEPIVYADRRLEPILSRTLGIPLFQEQVMSIAIALGDFTPGEANELRKNMGAWSMKGNINPWLEKLAQGLERHGVSKEFSDNIISQMKGFAEYGFPESHAVSFALIAYASAYLKAHFPAVFFTSILNSQPMGFYSPHVLIKTAQRDGVSVMPVRVLSSSWDSGLEVDAHRNFGIRLGFNQVKGISKEFVLRMTELRRKRTLPWSSLEEFLHEVKPWRHELLCLAFSDALKDFGYGRKDAVWISAGSPFAESLDEIDIQPSRLGSLFPSETRVEALEQDYAATGTCLFDHPVKVAKEECWSFRVPVDRISVASSLESLGSDQQVFVCGVVVIVQRPPTAKGMMFITVEDETGLINLALTPQAVDKFAHRFSSKAIMCVRGKLQKQGRSHSVLVAEVFAENANQDSVIPFRPPQKSLEVVSQMGEQGAVKHRTGVYSQ
jgi:error-prone DNA polymerase